MPMDVGQCTTGTDRHIVKCPHGPSIEDMKIKGSPPHLTECGRYDLGNCGTVL